MKNLLKRLMIRRRYRKMIAQVEDSKIFDGRNRGVDVYICENCGKKTLTRYKDKGVTPFIIRCRSCSGFARHELTVSEAEASWYACTGFTEVKNWVRPPLEWLLRQGQNTIDHVLDGGLVLEEKVLRESKQTETK